MLNRVPTLLFLLASLWLTAAFVPKQPDSALPVGEKYHFVEGYTVCKGVRRFFISEIKQANEDLVKAFTTKVHMQFPQYTEKNGCSKLEVKLSDGFSSSSECATARRAVLNRERTASKTVEAINW